jgi:hypothetical protein
MDELERLEMVVAAKLEEIRVNNDAAQTFRDEFRALYVSARSGDRKAMARCEELDAQLTARSQRGFELNNEYRHLVGKLADARQAAQITTSLSGRERRPVRIG